MISSLSVASSKANKFLGVSRKLVSHTSVIVVAKFHELRFELLPPYSLDLAPMIFSNLKKWVTGKRYTKDKRSSSTETNVYFEELKKLYCTKALKKLEYR